jgi:hypothetical protein
MENDDLHGHDPAYREIWITLGMELAIARENVRFVKSTLLRLATKRFGSAPPHVASTIEANLDRDHLYRILDRIFDATSWDDLLATP